jgi:hypothetical protein
MAIGNIVDVQITAGTVQPSRQAFGVPLLITSEAGAIIGYSASGLGSYVEVSSMREVLDYGFLAGSATYQLAEACFRQSPRPPTVMIGALRSPAPAQAVTITPYGILAGDVFTIAITDKNGVTESITATADATPTVAEIADALRASAAALTIAVTADVGPGSPLVLTGDVAGNMFGFELTSVGIGALSINIAETTATTGGYDDAASDILASSEGAFYGVVIDSQAEVNLDEMAAWALANDRIFAGHFADVLGSVASDATAKTATNERAFFLRLNGTAEGYDTFNFPQASWMADLFSRDPGAYTAAFKTLEGVPAEKMGTTYKSVIETAGSNWYALTKGVGITFPGKMASGEYIDVTIGLDWLVARMEERLYAAKLNNPKIPFTDGGIAIIRSEVEGQLTEAEAVGLIDSGWTVTVPAVADTTTADRAARTLNGVEFEARLQGAIHKTVVRGTVSV